MNIKIEKRNLFMTAVLIGTLLLNVHKSYSQNTGSHLSVSLGLNFQNFYGKDQLDNTLNNDILIAYHLGIHIEIPVIAGFYIKPALQFATKGSKSTEIIQGEINHITRKISYLEIPVIIIYKPMILAGHLIFGIGPYFAFGLGGNSKYVESNSSHDADIKFKDLVTANAPLHVDYFRPMDIGVNMSAGYQILNPLSIQINFQLGLSRINPEDERIFNDKSVVKNSGFGISISYKL